MLPLVTLDAPLYAFHLFYALSSYQHAALIMFSVYFCSYEEFDAGLKTFILNVFEMVLLSLPNSFFLVTGCSRHDRNSSFSDLQRDPRILLHPNGASRAEREAVPAAVFWRDIFHRAIHPRGHPARAVYDGRRP